MSRWVRRVGVSGVLVFGCGPVIGAGGTEGTSTTSGSSEVGEPVTSSTTSSTSTTGTETTVMPPATDTGDASNCPDGGDCTLIDILFVVDNSGTMGAEQGNFVAALPFLVEQIGALEAAGSIAPPDVNIMVTTSDFGHPLCTDFEPENYEPTQGAPIFTACNERIHWFTGVGGVEMVPEVCTDNCPSDLAPGGDPFIHYDAEGSNVQEGDVSGGLRCVTPMGISGCGYEAPLEAMLHALRPDACWNDPSTDGCDGHPEWSWVTRGFLREGSILAVAIITDEDDCSVQAPNGYAYFTNAENDEVWETHPDTGTRQPSSAICWNTGVACDDADGDGVKESCESADGDALHPISRYTETLTFAAEEGGHDVVMLGVFGVPPVTGRNPEPPYEPTAGGVYDLVYRDWRDGEYDGSPMGGDILPAEWAEGVTAAHKQWEHGIGPGCTAQGTDGTFFGQGVPPVRLKEVCESLNTEDRVRCCIESVCDEDLAPAMQCLAGLIEDAAAG